MAKERINVLVVEDSAVARALLVHILNEDPRLHVMGTSRNGREALEFVQQNTPDVILMDIHMPEMDGFEATRRIMETKPTPIVICSASGKLNETITGFRLMEAGAVAFVEKPGGPEHDEFGASSLSLRQTVKLMSEVKVIRRWPKKEPSTSKLNSPTRWESRQVQIVGIGASTGGPPVLQTIFSMLPKDLPVPIVAVQHIAPGFLGGLVEWLNQTTGLKVQIAGYGMQLMPGQVYLAPDDYHLSLRDRQSILLTREPVENGLRPAISVLFRSLAGVFGATALGVLLTGMGKDGAIELKAMKDRGAVTIAQDKESSVVHGMPGEAIALGGASHVLPPDKIASALLMLINGQPLS